ncbi:hypothetical protein HQ576_15990 [bacterium]|nr:hypothetical protein [bacterium]
MRASTFLLSVSVLWLAAAGRADTLGYSDGTTEEGTIRSALFRKGDSHGIYPGKSIRSIRLSVAAGDRVDLVSGGFSEGALVAVQFRTAKGKLIRVPRERLAVIEVSAKESTPAKPPTPKPPKPPTPPEKAAPGAPSTPEPPAKVPADEPKARGKKRPDEWYKNLDLRNRFWDLAVGVKKAEVDELKSQYRKPITHLLRDIQKLERTIRRKMDDREEEERAWRRERREQSKRRREGLRSHPVPPLEFKDGLEDDEAALADLGKTKLLIQYNTRKEMAKIAKRTEQRRRRVEAVYTRHKQQIEAGETLTVEAMVAAFKAGLGEPETNFGPPDAPLEKDGEAEKPKKK